MNDINSESKGAGAVSRYLKRGLAAVLLGILAWSPALITGSLMDRFSVNIPVWDDLERAELLERFEKGTLDWEYLASPHIEHRILIPRLIILANAKLGNGDIRNEVWVNFAAMLFSSIFLAALLWKTRPGRKSNWFIIFLFNLCVFSLLQYQNLCWAIQTAFFLPLTFLTGALLVLRSDLGWPWKSGLALVCALGGTFSFAHGLVIWPVVFAWLLLSGSEWGWKKRASAAGAWAAVAGLVFAAYFHNLSSTSHPGHSYLQEPGQMPPGLKDVVTGNIDPERVTSGFFMSLGNHFSRFILVEPKTAALWAGGILSGLFVVLASLAIFRWFRHRSREEWNNLLPWLALGGFVIASIFLISLGRSNASVVRTLSPRYLTISLYLTVALIALLTHLGPLLWRSVNARPRLQTAGFLLAGFFVALQAWNWLFGYRGLQLWHAARWQSLSAVVFRNFSDPEHPTRFDSDLDYAREQSDRLRALGYFELLTPLEPDDFSRFQISSKVLGGKGGAITRVEPVNLPVTGWRVEGFSDLQSQMERVPDAVVFTMGEGNGRILIGFAEPAHTVRSHYLHQDFEFSHLSLPDRESQNHWSGVIRADRLPESAPAAFVVTAWAVDLQKQRAYRHGETIRIDRKIRDPSEAVATVADEEPEN